jgi:t-SNARE complex subunit (syntaxin)
MDTVIDSLMFPVKDHTTYFNKLQDQDQNNLDEEFSHVIIDMEVFDDSPDAKIQQKITSIFSELDIKILTLENIITKEINDFNSDYQSVMSKYESTLNDIKTDMRSAYDNLKKINNKNPLYKNIYVNLLYRLTKYNEKINSINDKFMRIKDTFKRCQLTDISTITTTTSSHKRSNSDNVKHMQQQLILNTLDIEMNERDQGIINIAESVKELHHMFTELQILVEAQGQMLLKVEENVIKTLEHVEKGKEELKIGNELQKKTSKCCIIASSVMIFVIIGLITAIVIVMMNKK